MCYVFFLVFVRDDIGVEDSELIFCIGLVVFKNEGFKE